MAKQTRKKTKIEGKAKKSARGTGGGVAQGSSAQGASPASIYDVLKKDHEEVKGLLAELTALEAGRDPASLVEKIRAALVPHSRAEEAVFYNSLRERGSAGGKVLHSFREHMEAEAFLRALQVKLRLGADWKGTARDLRNAVEHHIREEEDDVFPLAKQVLPEQESVRLAGAFRKAKEAAKSQSFVLNTFTMMANLMPPKIRGFLREQQQRLAG